MFDIVRFGVEVVVLAALARYVVAVGAHHLAALALRELAHVDPDLLLVALAEVAVVHVCLVVAYRVWYFGCLSLGADGKLRDEALVAPRYVRVCLHASLHETEARWALVRHNRWSNWPQPFALGAAHLAFLFEDVECLGCVSAEEAGAHGNVAHAFRPISRRALRTELGTAVLDVKVAQLVTVVASLLLVSASCAAALAL